MRGAIDTAEGASRERRYRLALAAILLLALAVRVLARAATGAAEFYATSYSDYAPAARALAEGRGYLNRADIPLTDRPPLYALFVALLHGYRDFWPMVAAQSLVSTGTVACAALIARQLAGRRAALIAAAIVAIYPYYVRHDTALQETGLFTFVTALAMLLFLVARERRTALSAAAAGAMLGLATLTRPTVAPLIPLAAGWLALSHASGVNWASRVRGSLLALAAALAVLSPWLVRQHAVLGYWAFSTDFGRTLFVGNNPDTFAFYPKASIDKSQALAWRHSWPEAVRAGLERNIYAPGNGRWLRDRALRYIHAHPEVFVVNTVRKNIAAFGISPSPRHGLAENLAHALSYGPVLLLALIGLWRERQRWRLYSLFYALILVFVGETAVLWGHTSHRAFLDVYLIVFAAVALAPWMKRAVSAKSGA